MVYDYEDFAMLLRVKKCDSKVSTYLSASSTCKANLVCAHFEEVPTA